MIASNIGRKFLDAYNKKYGTDYDAKRFFVEVYYPLFFGHPKYLMTAGNSPLENPKISWDKMISGQIPFETPENRKDRFDALMSKIEAGCKDASVAIGYPASDVKEFATTSGQVTNIDFSITEEEVFLSWVGAGLGVGVSGGYTILFSDAGILLDLFDGWKVYRNVLETLRPLKGNQIAAWNGQWLAHRYSRVFDRGNPMSNFYPFGTKESKSVDILSWTAILIGIARTYNHPKMLGYVYKIGQMNTTIGFIPFALDRIRKPSELYRKLFRDDGRRSEKLWGTAMGFAQACQKGVIGLQAMEPKGLREYMNRGEMPKPPKSEEESISFQTYQIWLLAMLNNEELWDKSLEFAKELQAYVRGDKPKSTKRKNQVDSVLSSVNKKQFISSLTEVTASEKIYELAKLIHLMPADNVTYFLTLIRFHYAKLDD